MTAKRTTIGSSDLSIYPLGLGGNTFGMTTDAEGSEKVLDAFVASGGNFIDTADMYSFWVPGNSGGESETIIGDWMRKRGNRGDVVIATKVSGLPDLAGLAPTTIAAGAEASLKRLQTDHIDVYYAHYEDPKTPIAESAAAFDELVKAGKVRQVALSNLSPAAIEEWLSVAKENNLALPVALQPNYSLVHRRDYEQSLAGLAETHGLGVFPYSSLANGFLTGKYRSEADLEGRARGQVVKDYLNADGLTVLDALDEVARAHSSAVSTVALAWLLARPAVTAPLASATSVEQLAELTAAVDLELTADELTQLDTASAAFA
jgi:aryl-alcohol dehydrogenase-like predicted oxidoreductase